MTEERKQELRQLLSEVIKNVDIQSHSGENFMPMPKYIENLRARRQSYRPDLSGVLHYRPNVPDGSLKSRLFDFIKAEFAKYIRDDIPEYPRIQPASYGLRECGMPTGFSLERLLEKFLEIAIVKDLETAISAFDKCTTGTQGHFQKIVLLRGIELCLESEQIEAFERVRTVQISDGIQLVRMPLVPAESPNLPPYLPEDGFMTLLFRAPLMNFLRRTLIVIDCAVTPIFFQPHPIADLPKDNLNPFHFEILSAEFPNFDVDEFCRALSLSCNSGVEPMLEWNYIDEDEIFSMRGEGAFGGPNDVPQMGYEGTVFVSDAHIDEAKCLYETLVNLNPNVKEKLQIPITRWIKSKTPEEPIDKIIDLGIALEALYAPDSSSGEIRFKFAVRAACYLGDYENNRRTLMKEFNKIYDWRSKVVHTGNLPNKTKNTPFTHEEIKQFIEGAQDLCRKSILKVLEDGRFPDWNSLILGGEAEGEG